MLNNNSLNCVTQTMVELKGEINKSTIAVKDFNFHLNNSWKKCIENYQIYRRVQSANRRRILLSNMLPHKYCMHILFKDP